MFRKLKEEDGSGIIWAMAVAGFLLILVGAVLMLFYTLVDMYGKYVKKTAMEG